MGRLGRVRSVGALVPRCGRGRATPTLPLALERVSEDTTRRGTPRGFQSAALRSDETNNAFLPFWKVTAGNYWCFSHGSARERECPRRKHTILCPTLRFWVTRLGTRGAPVQSSKVQCVKFGLNKSKSMHTYVRILAVTRKQLGFLTFRKIPTCIYEPS